MSRSSPPDCDNEPRVPATDTPIFTNIPIFEQVPFPQRILDPLACRPPASRLSICFFVHPPATTSHDRRLNEISRPLLSPFRRTRNSSSPDISCDKPKASNASDTPDQSYSTRTPASPPSPSREIVCLLSNRLPFYITVLE